VDDRVAAAVIALSEGISEPGKTYSWIQSRVRRERALYEAIVALEDLDALAEARPPHTFSRQLGLPAGEGHPRHARSALRGRVERETAPAAADLEHVVVRPDAELLAEPPVLRLLGIRQRLAGMLEVRARVGQRLVEEEPEELVAEVVVVMDVLAGPAQAVRPRQMRPV
jgi:hypothetical protein